MLRGMTGLGASRNSGISGVAYVAGRYVQRRNAAVHIEDRGYQFADGVYEVIAVRRGSLVDEELHYDRLKRSLDSLFIEMPCSRAALGVIVGQIVRRNGLADGIVYLQVTRGVAPRNHAFPAAGTRPTLTVTASRLKPPAPEIVERGVSVVSVPESRWARRDIKSVSLLPNVLAKQEAQRQGAYEAWFVEENGEVTEGSSTNAWIVTDGQEVVTRPLGPQILAGITRHSVIEAARQANIRITERPFTLEEAKAAREAFVTSTTSFVLPVVSIDGRPVGDGKPGPVARALLSAYRDHISG